MASRIPTAPVALTRRPAFRLFSTGAVIRTVLLAVILSGASFSVSYGNDFQALQTRISAQREVVRDIRARFDRVDPRLLEPLVDLARAQTAAYRFDDAEQSLDQALQVVRVGGGLYAPAQYPILEQKIENDILRGAWYSLTGKLEHVSWLYSEKFRGSAEQQVERLMWLSGVFQQGAYRDLEIRRIDHLRNATRTNELASELAIRNPRLSLERKTEILYELVKKYHVEAQGILSGGEFGLTLRRKRPDSGEVDSRKLALRKRFVYGLRLLETIREAARSERPGAAETLALLDVAIADWHLMFDRSEAYGIYRSAYEQLIAAGIPADRADTLFGQPLALPRPSLALNVDAALSDQSAAGAGVVVLLESSSSFPGIAEPLAADGRTQRSPVKRYTRAAARLEFEPGSGSSHWLSGTYRQTLGTPSRIEYQADAVDEQDSRRILLQLRELRFRPVQKNGELQPAAIQVDYRIRRNESTRQIVLPPTLVGQR